MSKCKACGAHVNLAPDGDPKYDPPRKLRKAYPLETVDQVHDWHHGQNDEGFIPVPGSAKCAQDLRDDGFHPEATCVDRMAARIFELEAMVAAALREAADIAHGYGEEQYSENVGLHPEYADNAQEDAQEIMQRILDITPEDAKKALDAKVQEAVKAERERIFDWLRKNLPDGHAIVATIREGDRDE